MASAVSKSEYLKRYMSGAIREDNKNKKKKKKKLNKLLAEKPRVRIVDDDVDLKSLLPENLENTLEEDVGDNEPTVAEVVDERPEHIKRLEQYRHDTRWKVLGHTPPHHDQVDPEEYGLVGETHQISRHDSDSDQSPVSRLRTNRHGSDHDQSPLRTTRHDSDSDQSPVRTNRDISDSDQSPVRKNKNRSDSDQSPPRKGNGSDSDQSPPRRKGNGSDSDQSPPRRKGNDSDSDQSLPRRKKTRQDSDQSPPRKKPRDDNRQADSNDRQKRTDGKPVKTLAGAKAGLSSAKEVRREAELLKKKHDSAFGKIDEHLLGRNAKTVFRDRKTGKRRNLKEEREKEDEDNKKKKEEEEKYKRWGKGLKQGAEQAVAVSETLHEFSKPLARYRDDEDLDSMLKDRDREGDPMLAFITKKNTDKTKKEKPQYKGPYPPNRFGIRPGYRWDGVDRSSGFEKQYFAKMADRRATKDMAYKWSIEDM